MKLQIEQLKEELKYQSDRLKHNKHLLDIERGNIEDAELKKAKAGIGASTELENIIKDTKVKISEIKEKIEKHEVNIQGIQEKIRNLGQESSFESDDIETSSKALESEMQIKRIPLGTTSEIIFEESDVIAQRSPRQAKKITPFHSTTLRVNPYRLTGLLILLILILLLNIFWVWPLMWTAVFAEKYIDENYHHLGDNTYNEEYIASIQGDKIINPSPESISYSAEFSMRDMYSLANLPENISIMRAEIFLTVNALKPRQDAPVVLILNDSFQGFLNDYVGREQFKREKILLEVNKHDLLNGMNRLIIATGIDQVEGDYEDFEFNDLGIRIWFDYKKINLNIAAISLLANSIVGVVLFNFFRKIIQYN